MLSEATCAVLNSLTYRADANRWISLLPLGGIFWEDELPNTNQFLLRISDDQRRDIIRLFGIRVRLWKGDVLSDEDQQFWDRAHAVAPGWALFERLSVSPDELREQEETAKQADIVFEGLIGGADKVEINEQDGVQSFSATFNLYKNHDAAQSKKSLWRRMFRRMFSRGS